MAEKPGGPRGEYSYPLPTYTHKYKSPHFPIRELPKEKVDYFLVLDFEAVINKDEGCPDVMEMIEFPVLKINVRTFETEATFHTYIQPIIHPKLNSFITDLTGITQDMVDGQPILPEVLKSFDGWMRSEGLLNEGVNFIFVTCGDWDLKSGLSKNCDYLKLSYPVYLKRWVNIKTYFQAIIGKKGHGMKSMMNGLKLTLDGKHHSGIDDSRNIAKILHELVKLNESLRQGWVIPRALK